MTRRLSEMTENDLKSYMQALAKATGAVIPDGSAFALLVFDPGCDPQYVSSANRAEMIQALRACADRLERRETIERVGFVPHN